MKQLKKYRSAIIVTVIALGAIGALVYTAVQPGKLDAFAQCLEDKGAVFWGAFWCPHCQDQKAMFGKSQKQLPYRECSTPDGQRQTQQCIDEGIETYPTWDFADGERTTGVLPLKTLSDRTGCELPQS